MGNLLKVLTREIENYPHFFLDFESKFGAGVEGMEKGWMEKGGVNVVAGFLFYQQDFPGGEASEDPAAVLLRCTFFLDYLTVAHIFFPFFFFLFCRSQMGNLLKLLTCTELEQGPNFFLDFESELS